MLITLMLALTAIIGYIMGSVNGSIIVSRFLFGSDVRRQGSGNAGLTNFYRTYGITGIVGVIAIDVRLSAAFCSIWPPRRASRRSSLT